MANAKSWSYKAGEKGRNRVRAYEDRTGFLLVEFYETAPNGSRKRKRVSLGHRDRARAKRQADEVAAKLGAGWDPDAGGITLEELFDIYLREVTPGKSRGKQKHDRACAEMLLRFLGGGRQANTLSRRDWDRFVRERGSGAIGPSQRRRTTGVGPRQIAYDLSWLRAVLNWATTARDARGRVMLERNPLQGLPLPREESPKRPLVSDERYKAMLAVADSVDWRCKVALVLAYETGHRINAIRQLQWSDIDLHQREIRWRAELDKIGHYHVTPITPAAVAALERAQRATLRIGDGWVFPSPTDPEKPCSRHLVRDWWLRLEEAAGLSHIEQLGWHGLRRRFATDLKEEPLRDACELGGWKDPQTLLKCYQHSDAATMRKVLERRKRRAVGA